MEEHIEHYGVKGMRWGVRKDRPAGVSRKTNRAAKKDAKEFTRAKMYYGEGAGTRRKLIKAKVNQRSKDPSYKKAFDHHVANTNMEKRGQQARSERHKNDVKNTTKKTARGIVNIAAGNASRASAGLIAAYGGYKLANRAGLVPSPSEVLSNPKVQNALGRGLKEAKRRAGL